MLGAIIGDTVGSVYEFNNIKTKEFPLFSRYSRLTDDSIMTLAVCECLQNRYPYDEDNNRIIDTLKKWGKAFPNAGYGGMFYRWVLNDEYRKPYNSYGNGSAMRVSACGWYGNSEEEVKLLATRVTEVTHNHPEGIKGAIVTAMCVYYARIGKTKEFIEEYVEKYYSLDFDYEELRRNYYHAEEICQNTVPQAIYCFLISKNFEDCLRTTISIGGDCDTTASISCAIAEAYYKYIPGYIIEELYKRLPSDRGDCSPRLILNNYIKTKLFLNTTCENIDDNTYVLAVIRDNKISWSYSHHINPLIRDALYYGVLEYSLFNKDEALHNAYENIDAEGYFDAIFNDLGYTSTTARKLLLVRDECYRLYEVNTYEEADFTKINEVFTRMDIVVFKNPKEALHFVNEKYNIVTNMYNDFFSEDLMLK